MKTQPPIWIYGSIFFAVIIMAGLALDPAFATQERANPSPIHSQDLSSPEGPSSPQAFCSPDTPNMLAYWPMDDPSGATTFAEIFNGKDGICSGDTCPTKSTGILSGAFNFATQLVGGVQTGDKITVPDFPEWDWTGSQSFSAEAWVNIPANKNCQGRKVFIGRRQTPSAWWLGCGGEAEQLNKAVFKLRDSLSVENSAFGTTNLNDGEWHHVVGRYNGTSNKIEIYVDGVLEGEAIQNFSGDLSGNNGLNIGWFNVAPWYYLEGRLDEIALYNKALDLADIQRHYNDGAPESYCSAGPVYIPLVSRSQ